MTRLILTIFLLSGSAFGADTTEIATIGTEPQCIDLVKECLSKLSEIDRSGCLTSSKRHPFCEGSLVIKLIDKRALFSSPILEETEASGALLGLHTGDALTNTSCIRDCDKQLLELKIPRDSDVSINIDSTIKCYDRCKDVRK